MLPRSEDSFLHYRWDGLGLALALGLGYMQKRKREWRQYMHICLVLSRHGLTV
jgi:hypothetical protein